MSSSRERCIVVRKIGFAGTSFFAIPFFTEIHKTFEVPFVLTKDIPATKQQDNLHNFMRKNGYTVPMHTDFAAIDPAIFDDLDAMVVVAYGHKIPAEFLARTKWINVHGSLLPMHRGAAPIQYTVFNHGAGAGLTAILMNAQIDAGGIISQIKAECGPEDTFTSLSQKLIEIGVPWFRNTLEDYLDGKIQVCPQNSQLATKAPSIKENDRVIDWTQSAEEVRARINGLSSFPCCIIRIGNFRLKALRAVVVECDGDAAPGTLMSAKHLLIKCGSGCVRITSVVPESSKPMSDEEFCRGRDISCFRYVV